MSGLSESFEKKHQGSSQINMLAFGIGAGSILLFREQWLGEASLVVALCGFVSSPILLGLAAILRKLEIIAGQIEVGQTLRFPELRD